MKNLLLIGMVLFITIPTLSQGANPESLIFQNKNSINVEIGGYTVAGAVYYERVIINKPKFKTVGQIGYGLSGWPVGLHNLISFNKHHIEFGGCITFPAKNNSFSSASNAYVTGRLGYRFQKPGGNFIFRAGLMPVVIGADRDYGPEMILWVWPGLSFGYAF